MVSLTGWSAPTSVPALAKTGDGQQIRYVNGHFIAMSAVNSGANAEIRYTTDAKGTWSSATLPARPSGVTAVSSNSPGRVSWDGTYYATAVQYTDFGSTNKARVLYATTLGGTWTSYEFDTSNNYFVEDIAYLNGQWVMTGQYRGVDPYPAFIATCSTPMGTWTFNTSAATTGLDPTGMPLGTGVDIQYIDYANGEYVYLGGTNIKTSTSLTSGWTSPSSILGPPSYYYVWPSFLSYVNGYWVSMVWDGSLKPILIYASDPAGSWSSVSSADLGLNTASRKVTGISHDGTNWVIVGTYDTTAYARYYASTGAPTGPWTSAASGMPSSMAHSVVYVDPIHVTVHDNGNIRYSNDIPFPTPSTAPSLLRQRQSPRRSPSRVDYPNLRQRQTPYIR